VGEDIILTVRYYYFQKLGSSQALLSNFSPYLPLVKLYDNLSKIIFEKNTVKILKKKLRCVLTHLIAFDLFWAFLIMTTAKYYAMSCVYESVRHIVYVHVCVIVCVRVCVSVCIYAGAFPAYLKKSSLQKILPSLEKHLSVRLHWQSVHWTHLTCQTWSSTFSKKRSSMGCSHPAHSTSMVCIYGSLRTLPRTIVAYNIDTLNAPRAQSKLQ